ncbi:MAG: hypothetical protein J7K00_04285 [Candidatus Diapherotrites archaeon]|nr:hypothetical protein [Candidatus Diapherotrites archaeon]
MAGVRQEKYHDDFVKSGIEGFDDLFTRKGIPVGLPRGSVVLLSGSCGAGKSIFSAQFLYKGIINCREPGLYVSVDETTDNLWKVIYMFNWAKEHPDALRRKGLLHNMQMIGSRTHSRKDTQVNYETYLRKLEFAEFLKKLKQIVATYKIKRLVIDSSSQLSMHFKTELERRSGLIRLINLLKRLDCTSIFTSEIFERGPITYSRLGMEEFLADGVIVLRHTEARTGLRRHILVKKMRGLRHDEDFHPFVIDEEEGVRIFPQEKVF